MGIALITGATSGMGKDFVYALADRADISEFWLVGRRTDRLNALQQEIGKPCRLFSADLSVPEGVQAIDEALKSDAPEIDLLVNSAGFGIIGSVDKADISSQTGMIDVNCRALVALTKSVLPYMHSGSRIINLASSAAFLPQPYFAVYAATKSFVLSFSRALNEELRKNGISVTAVCPGPVKTEFFDIAERTGKIKTYKMLVMADSKATVKRALKASQHRRAVCTPSFLMRCFRFMCKILPHGLMIKFIK